MARTSRKGGVIQTIPTEKIWNTALYARLSLEDSGRKGADTIDTQIELIHSYVSDRPYLVTHELTLTTAPAARISTAPPGIA